MAGLFPLLCLNALIPTTAPLSVTRRFKRESTQAAINRHFHIRLPSSFSFPLALSLSIDVCSVCFCFLVHTKTRTATQQPSGLLVHFGSNRVNTYAILINTNIHCHTHTPTEKSLHSRTHTHTHAHTQRHRIFRFLAAHKKALRSVENTKNVRLQQRKPAANPLPFQILEWVSARAPAFVRSFCRIQRPVLFYAYRYGDALASPWTGLRALSRTRAFSLTARSRTASMASRSGFRAFGGRAHDATPLAISVCLALPLVTLCSRSVYTRLPLCCCC